MLGFTALKVGEAGSLVDEVVGRALRAEAIGVNLALRVSQLTFTVRIEEVNPIAVHADARGIEVPAVLVSVLASVVLVELVSLHAGEALGLLDVVIEAVGVLVYAKVLAVQGKSLLAANANSIFVGVAVADLAGGIFGELEGIFALIAAIVIVKRATVDAALSVAECKRRLARAAVITIIVDAS